MQGFQVLLLLSLGLTLTLAKNALVIIDVQNCFMPGGALPVPAGDGIVGPINRMREKHAFDAVFLSQDWHCSNHVSFASQHKGYAPSDLINLQYNKEGKLCRTQNVTNDFSINCKKVSHEVSQILWPDHCIKGTEGAKFHPDLIIKDTDKIIKKGNKCQVDSYSAFYDNGRFSHTELHTALQNASVDSVYFVGLAIDYCVSWSALDANSLGYKTFVVLDASKGFGAEAQKAVEKMIKAGVTMVHSSDLQPAKSYVSHKSEASTGAIYSIPLTLLVLMLSAILNEAIHF